MSIQGGMLEALGINMYTTLGKCLVEFVANAFDAEAGSVEITMPVEKIDVARKEVRNAAKVEAAAMVKEAGYKPASQRASEERSSCSRCPRTSRYRSATPATV